MGGSGVKVLVTGGLGFVGRAVVRELRQVGHDVTVLTRQPAGQPGPDGARLVRADLTCAAAIADLIGSDAFDGICHLAGRTSIRDSYSQATAYFEANLVGTVNLLKAVLARYAKTGAPTRIAFASSSAVYATRQEPLAETDPVLPASPYGVTKLTAEQLLEFESRTGALGVATLRAFNVSGGAPAIADPDNDRLVPRLVEAIKGMLPMPELVPRTSRWDFVHVLDVGRAFAAALEQAEPGVSRVYNVGTGVGTTAGQLAAVIEEAAGRKMPSPLTLSRDDPDGASWVADISLIRRDLGWTPRFGIDAIVGDAWQFADGGGEQAQRRE
jgi:UDP-glucose 4-epimerase